MRAIRRVAGAPDDPLGPNGQDADEIRERACRLTAPETACIERDPDSVTDGGGAGGGGFGAVLELLLWILFIGLVAALLATIIWVVVQRAPSRPRRARPRAAEEADGADEELVVLGRTQFDREHTPAQWRQDAEEHRRAGRHRDALRCRYRAMVGELARRDLIDEIPGRTTGEEREQLERVVPTSSATFGAAADLFDGAWYGHVHVDDDDVERMIALEREVLQTVGRAPAGEALR